jgi:prepilin-type processing-associated H-X9-DG protein
MDNTALAMDEERLLLFGLRALSEAERECIAVFADGHVTPQERDRVMTKLQVLGASINAQLAKDREDISLSQRLTKRINQRINQKETPLGKAALR